MPTQRILAGLLGALLALALSATSAAQAPPQAPVQDYPYDQYKAEKNLEVGIFYLKKKNYDAAIERLLDATRYRPNYARPHRLLGEAYEKKGEKATAVRHYERYLEILPMADDAEKVGKRVAKLKEQIEKEKRARPRRSG